MRPKRFHGTVTLDATRVGRDASRIADEVIAHLAGLVGARVTVTIEIEAEIPAAARQITSCAPSPRTAGRCGLPVRVLNGNRPACRYRPMASAYALTIPKTTVSAL